MSGSRPGGTRFLASVLASLLLVATAVAVDRSRTEPLTSDVAAGSAPSSPQPPVTPAPPRTEPPSPAPDPGLAALELLESVERAAAASAEELLAAGLAVAQGPWRDLTHPDWHVREERPVYVAGVSIDAEANRVEATSVIAWRQEEAAEQVVLRSLAASADLQDRGGTLEAAAWLDGTAVPVVVDADGARVVVDAPVAPGAHHLRVTHHYDLVATDALAGDGGPASFGLLARATAADGTPTTANLGHWLPLLTFDPAPMVEWGDLGAFPPAIWSVVVEHPGWLVTGGEEDACPGGSEASDGIAAQEPGCTWARGVALRDVSAVWFADAPRVAGQRFRQLDVRTLAPAGTVTERTNQTALAESAASADIFTRALGPLAWRELDVVAAPLLAGAAGMEFPGLVIIDTDVYGALDGAIGTYVITHEVAHQWFHALVGNSSLDSPVVDEAIAQYLSYLYWVETYGEEAAAAFAEATLRRRYESARERGIDDEPPAQPLDEFSGDESYGPLVYARAPLAFVDAEALVGRRAVLGFLAHLVDRYGLEHLTDDELLAEAEAFSPELAAVIDRYWFDPTPLGEPSG